LALFCGPGRPKTERAVRRVHPRGRRRAGLFGAKALELRSILWKAFSMCTDFERVEAGMAEFVWGFAGGVPDEVKAASPKPPAPRLDAMLY
jgi:hypothetical protein